MELKSTLKGVNEVLSIEMKKIISKQLSLRRPEDILPVLPKATFELINAFTVCGRRLWNSEHLSGDKLGVWGDACGVTGDVSNIKGCLTSIYADAKDVLDFLLEEQKDIDEQG